MFNGKVHLKGSIVMIRIVSVVMTALLEYLDLWTKFELVYLPRPLHNNL